jgi:hypothetical protein
MALGFTRCCTTDPRCFVAAAPLHVAAAREFVRGRQDLRGMRFVDGHVSGMPGVEGIARSR